MNTGFKGRFIAKGGGIRCLSSCEKIEVVLLCLNNSVCQTYFILCKQYGLFPYIVPVQEVNTLNSYLRLLLRSIEPIHIGHSVFQISSCLHLPSGSEHHLRKPIELLEPNFQRSGRIHRKQITHQLDAELVE